MLPENSKRRLRFLVPSHDRGSRIGRRGDTLDRIAVVPVTDGLMAGMASHVVLGWL